MKGMRWLGFLVLAVALVGFGYWLRAPAQGTAVAEALATGDVEMEAVAWGSDGSGVNVTLRRPMGRTGSMRVSLEAGTILYTGEHQRLIVANTVAFALSEQQPETTQTVETFCIDEFLSIPPQGVAVSLSPPTGGYVSTEETEPLHKLVTCLASEDLPQSDKQLAVWAVSENLMDKSRDEAIDIISRGLAERMGVERREQLVARKPELMQKAPNLSSERIDQLIEAELADGASELQSAADRKAQEQVANFVDHDKYAMQKCGYPVATLQIFQ